MSGIQCNQCGNRIAEANREKAVLRNDSVGLNLALKVDAYTKTLSRFKEGGRKRGLNGGLLAPYRAALWPAHNC